ncbi:MAG: hypothetical protein H6727_01040 [Myxococcales bacterium]|nr:hypothetical protein [Myxococcales bacterium]
MSQEPRQSSLPTPEPPPPASEATSTEQAPSQEAVALPVQEAEASEPKQHGPRYITRDRLREVVQDPEKGIFVFHQRSRRRIFLHHFGLKRLEPPPDSPVVRMDSTAFAEILSEEEPELAKELANKKLPPKVLLIEQLTQRQLKRAKPAHLWWRYWSWCCIGGLMSAWEKLDRGAAGVRAVIGHTSFESMRGFLMRERFLVDATDDEEVATTLVAWWAGMGVFSPSWRAELFPSIDAEKLDAWLEEAGLPIDDVVKEMRPRVEEDIPLQLARGEDHSGALLLLADAPHFTQRVSAEDKAEIALLWWARHLSEESQPQPILAQPEYYHPEEQTVQATLVLNEVTGSSEVSGVRVREQQGFEQDAHALPAWSRPAWLPYLEEEELRRASERCQREARVLRDASSEKSENLRKRSVAIELMRLVASTVWWWIQVRLWGRLISVIPFATRTHREYEASISPAQSKPSGFQMFFLRFAARQALRTQVFEFIHSYRWAVREEWRGNEAEAALQCGEAIRFFRGMVIDKPSREFLEELVKQQQGYQDKFLTRFCERYPLKGKMLKQFSELVLLLLSVPLSARLGRLAAASLKSLQRGYLDQERLFFVTRLMRWLLNKGQVSLQIPLEHYGLIRAMHYLQVSLRRLESLPLPEDQLEHWLEPVREANQQIEQLVRDTFGPRLLEAMNEVGLVPTDLREEVAQARIRDDIMDLVVRRGQFSFSDLRDVISRNELRLPVSTWRDFLHGDILLKLNEALQPRFHDVYRAGEIYLRVNQRFSALAFGTRWGRWCCLNLVLPFGGAVALLMTVGIIVDYFNKLVLNHVHFYSSYSEILAVKESLPVWVMDASLYSLKLPKVHLWEFVGFQSVLFLGLLVYLIMHTETGWDLFRRVMSGLGTGLRFLFIEGPRWLYHHPWLQFVLTHPRAFFVYRHIVLPLFVALLFTFIGSTVLRITMRNLNPQVIHYHVAFGWQFLSVVAWAGFLYFMLNTSIGRAVWDWTAYRLLALWSQIRDRLVVGLIRWILEVFRQFLIALDYVIYRVDDLLRFHEGESRQVIWVKSVLQSFWFGLTYLVRVIVNLVAEPQLNPVKHFPVVTISHKLLIPGTIVIITAMESAGFARSLVWIVGLFFQFGLPGLCGFLAWELKENWKLFRANQPAVPPPVRVGSHGETVDALLRRGFHSGTLPRAYEKLFKVYKKSFLSYDEEKVHRIHHDLHHVAEDMERFIERELIASLHRAPAFENTTLRFSCKHIETERSHLDVLLELSQEEQSLYLWRLRYELENGWLVASLRMLQSPAEGLRRLTLEEQLSCDEHFVFFLQKSGVRIVRGKLEEWLGFYLRGFEIVTPGGANSSQYAEYWVEKDRVRVSAQAPGTQVRALFYELTMDGKLREPAPTVVLETKDKILPRHLSA